MPNNGHTNKCYNWQLNIQMNEFCTEPSFSDIIIEKIHTFNKRKNIFLDNKFLNIYLKCKGFCG